MTNSNVEKELDAYYATVVQNKNKKIIFLLVGCTLSAIALLPLLASPLSYRCPPYLEGPINLFVFVFLSWVTTGFAYKIRGQFTRPTHWLLLALGMFLSLLALFSLLMFIISFINGESFPDTPPKFCSRLKF